MKHDAASRFEALAEMPVEDLARLLKGMTPDAAAAWFGEHTYLVPFLDAPAGGGNEMIVSDHVNALRSASRGYGKGERPDEVLGDLREAIWERAGEPS